MKLLRRLLWLFQRRQREADLRDELAFHLAAETEDRISEGASPDEARRMARRDLGNVALTQEDTRAAWGWMSLEHLLQDLRYALRGLRKDAAFTATAVLSLALGIGANTAIFTLIDALLLRWLPVRDPQGLVQLQYQSGGPPSFSYAITKGLAERKDIFAGLGGFSSWSFNVGTPGTATRVPGALVTGEYYTTLGLNPAAGRLLAPEDDQPGAALVAVLSHGYWERQFAREPDAIGRTILVNGVPVKIIGVSPPAFVGANVGSVADITMAVAALPSVSPEAAPLLGQGNFWLRILARPAVSSAESKARLAAVWPRIAERVVSPRWPADRKKALAEAVFELTPGGTGSSYLRATFQKPLFVLMAAVAVVLLIACVNVANLTQPICYSSPCAAGWLEAPNFHPEYCTT
jgi:hypothetical protein